MISRPRRPGPPSWLGTLIVAIATVAMFLYAAARLRGAVTPLPASAAPRLASPRAGMPAGPGAH